MAFWLTLIALMGMVEGREERPRLVRAPVAENPSNAAPKAAARQTDRRDAPPMLAEEPRARRVERVATVEGGVPSGQPANDLSMPPPRPSRPVGGDLRVSMRPVGRDLRHPRAPEDLVADLRGNDEGMLQDVVARYRFLAPLLVAELRVGAAEGDLRLVARIARSLQGSSHLIGAREPEQAARALEIAVTRAAREGRAFDAGSELMRLARAVSVLVAALPYPGTEIGVG
jgi:hypothetical protein